MATAEDVRKFALALEGTTEVDHWGRPSFRTKKRIFAVIRPDGLFLHLPEERAEFLFEADPQIFIRFMWGKASKLIVNLKKIGKTELKALIAEAHENAKPIAKTRTAKSRR